MRRSLYQRTFLAGSTLYRGAERRQSTLPSHVRIPVATLTVPVTSREEARPAIMHFSCSETVHSPERPAPRPYRSTGDELDTPSFPLRIKTDLSADSFRHSQDSESTSSYMSPRSHRSTSNPIEELELEVFSRQSSEASEEFRSRRKHITDRLHSFQEEQPIDFDCVKPLRRISAGNESTETIEKIAKNVDICEKETTDVQGTVRHALSDSDHGEGYVFALKQFESFDRLCLSRKNSEEESEESPCNKGEVEFFKHGLIPWKKGYCEDEDNENLASNREEGAISFKFDVLSEKSDKDPDSPSILKEEFNFRKGLFPKARKPVMKMEGEAKDEGDSGREGDRDIDDEGFECPRIVDGEDLLSSQLELRRREAFRKERSLDSDETSGFVSKHSSETTDLSSRLSSTQFTTKHLSEPLSVSSACAPGDMPQHLSEPSDFGSRVYLSVDIEGGTGAISKKREHFRKSKRLKHFNLRRIDDTDNDSSCDSDRQLQVPDEPPEPPSTRLKEEVGLPKHLSRDSSVDRYGLYKSRSEKTITSFESDRLGQGRLQDFESFCEAVTFTRHVPAVRPKAASADETEVSEPEQLFTKSRTSKVRRKSRSKRDLTRHLNCLLL